MAKLGIMGSGIAGPPTTIFPASFAFAPAIGLPAIQGGLAPASFAFAPMINVPALADAVSDVTILDAFADTGATSPGTAGSFTVSAGNDRIVWYVIQFAGTDTLGVPSYGGQVMTLGATIASANAFPANVRAYYLLEAGIAAAVGTGFTISGTVGGRYRAQAASFEDVDQQIPIVDTQTLLGDLSAGDMSLTVEEGGFAIAAATVINASTFDWTGITERTGVESDATMSYSSASIATTAVTPLTVDPDTSSANTTQQAALSISMRKVSASLIEPIPFSFAPSIGSPTIANQASGGLSPTVLAFAPTVNAPTIDAVSSGDISPTSFAFAPTFGSPTLAGQAAGSLSPASFAFGATIGSPTIAGQAAGSLSPSSFAFAASIGSPTVAEPGGANPSLGNITTFTAAGQTPPADIAFDHNNDGDGPLFVFAVSMDNSQTHTSFTGDCDYNAVAMTERTKTRNALDSDIPFIVVYEIASPAAGINEVLFTYDGGGATDTDGHVFFAVSTNDSSGNGNTAVNDSDVSVTALNTNITVDDANSIVLAALAIQGAGKTNLTGDAGYTDDVQDTGGGHTYLLMSQSFATTGAKNVGGTWTEADDCGLAAIVVKPA